MLLCQLDAAKRPCLLEKSLSQLIRGESNSLSCFVAHSISIQCHVSTYMVLRLNLRMHAQFAFIPRNKITGHFGIDSMTRGAESPPGQEDQRR